MLTFYSKYNAIDRLLGDPWILPMRRHKEMFANIEDGISSFSCEVPGIPKDKLVIIWKENVLSISGKTETRSVSYKVSMPDINTRTLKAECLDGVLTVSADVFRPEEEKAVSVVVK